MDRLVAAERGKCKARNMESLGWEARALARIGMDRGYARRGAAGFGLEW